MCVHVMPLDSIFCPGFFLAFERRFSGFTERNFQPNFATLFENEPDLKMVVKNLGRFSPLNCGI